MLLCSEANWNEMASVHLHKFAFPPKWGGCLQNAHRDESLASAGSYSTAGRALVGVSHNRAKKPADSRTI